MSAAHFERETIVVVWLTIVLLCARLWLAGHLELMFDEAYYALWAKHLAWCYLDHPPMVALWIRLSTFLFGESAFGVRALGVLTATAGSAFVYLLTQRLYSDQAEAAFAALLYCAMLLISAGAIIMTPDTPLLFFWAVALYGLARLYSGGGAAWWAVIGLAMGLALQSKYSALLLGAGIPCAMLLVPSMRKWWRHPAPYLAGILAFTISLPVVAWNYQHDWASFAKQFGRARANGLAPRFVGELIASQVGLLTPFVFALAAGGVWLAWNRRKHADRDASLFLVTLIGPMLTYFVVHSLHARVHGNWLAPLYPVLAPLGAEAAFQLARFPARVRPVIAVSRRLAVPTGVAMTAILYLQALAAPIPLKAASDPTALMAGWSALANEIDDIARRERAAYILTSRYRLTGELAYYGSPSFPVLQYNERVRWLSFPQPEPSLLSQTALYVADVRRDRVSQLCGRFAKVKRIGEISRRRGGSEIERYVIYRLDQPTAPVLGDSGPPED